MIAQFKSEFNTIAAQLDVGYTTKKMSELEDYVQNYEFERPLINLIPIDSFRSNIGHSGQVMYVGTCKLQFITKAVKSDNFEDKKDELLQSMILLAQSFYRQLDKNERRVFRTPRWEWSNRVIRMHTSNYLVAIESTINFTTSCANMGQDFPVVPCPSARAIITDQDSNVLADETIPSGGVRTIRLNVTVNKPEFVTITSDNITIDSFDVFAQLDVDGTMYALILEQGDPIPSVQDVIDDGVELPDDGSGNTFEFTELEEDTTYVVYLAAVDFAGTKSENVDSLEVTTDVFSRAYVIPQDIRDSGFNDNIFLQGNEVVTDYDFFKYRDSITGNTAYIDPDAPDGGDGSEETPFNNITTAFANSSFNIYLFKAGSVFKELEGDTRIIPQTRAIKISTYGGSEKAQITSQIDLTGWSVNADFSNVYEASHPTGTAQRLIGSACDEANINEFGKAIGLNRVTSIALVSSTPNSFFYNSSTLTVYVRTIDDRIPDENIRLFMNGSVLRLLRFGAAPVAGHDGFYMENIRLLGANPFRNMNTSATSPTFADFYNCDFDYAGQKDGFFLQNNANHIGALLECTADYPTGDGFNYNSALGYVLEWNCKSKYTTVQAGGNNGSTSHVNSTVIRVLGDYRFWSGKAVQDINNSRTLSIRCYVSDSVGSSPNDYAYASNSASGFTRMWLYECIADQPRGYDNFNNSEMNIYDGDFGNVLTRDNRDQAGSILNILTEEDVFE
jgi:hypothetical protein